MLWCAEPIVLCLLCLVMQGGAMRLNTAQVIGSSVGAKGSNQCPHDVAEMYKQLSTQTVDAPDEFLPLLLGHVQEASQDKHSLALSGQPSKFAGNGLRDQYGGKLPLHNQNRLYLMEWCLLDKFIMPHLKQALEGTSGHYLMGGVALNFYLDELGKPRIPTDDMDLGVRMSQIPIVREALQQLLSSNLVSISDCFSRQSLANIAGFQALKYTFTGAFGLLHWKASGSSFMTGPQIMEPVWLFLDLHYVSDTDRWETVGGKSGGKWPVPDLRTELQYAVKDDSEFKWYKAKRRALRLKYVQTVAPQLFQRHGCNGCEEFLTARQSVPSHMGEHGGQQIEIRDGMTYVGGNRVHIAGEGTTITITITTQTTTTTTSNQKSSCPNHFGQVAACFVVVFVMLLLVLEV